VLFGFGFSAKPIGLDALLLETEFLRQELHGPSRTEGKRHFAMSRLLDDIFKCAANIVPRFDWLV